MLSALNYSENRLEVEANYADFDTAGLDLIKKLFFIKGNALSDSNSGDSVTSGIFRVSDITLKRAGVYLNAMNKAMAEKNIDAFNFALCMLISALPTSTSAINSLIAEKDTMNETILWCEAYVDAIQKIFDSKTCNLSQTSTSNLSKYKAEIDWLRKINMSIKKTSPDEDALIKSKMGPDSSKFIRAWAVHSDYASNRFASYVAHKNIKKSSLLWHGSPTFNFISILENGFSLKKAKFGMFGKGIYFAPSFDKSRGYCSVSGARWRGDKDKTAFLALAEVATGNPLYTSSSCTHSNRTNLPEQYNSLWARKGAELYRDEVIVYDSSATRIKYIVETS